MAAHTQKRKEDWKFMGKWYVLHVLTKREFQAVEDIKKYNAVKFIENVFPFIPSTETYFRRKLNIKKEEKYFLFPGYVFFETPMDTDDILDYANGLIKNCQNIIKILRYGDSREMAVEWDEQFELMKFMDDKFCIRASEGYKIKDAVTIMDGPLVGCEGIIEKIDRHKMEASIHINLFGENRLIKLGLYVVLKQDE